MGVLAIVLIVWTVMHVYVFWRLRSVPIVSRIPRYVIAITGSFLWVRYSAAQVLDHSLLARFLEVIGANWVGILFLLLVCFLIVDLVTLFGWFGPRFARTLRVWASVAGVMLSIIAFVQAHRMPVIDRYEVPSAGLPAEMDGTVLILASDFPSRNAPWEGLAGSTRPTNTS